MSFRAIIDTIVHVDSFRNIDLFQQGLYCVNFSLNYTSRKGVYPSSPCFYHTGGSDNHKGVPQFPAEIDESIFRTQGFLIKYSDEEVELNDLGVFRSEIELYPGVEDVKLTLKVDLLHYNVGLLSRPDRLNADNVTFVTVSTVYIDIASPLKGVNSFCPVTFDENYFCLLNTAVHSMLVDFRFRMTPLKTPREEHISGLMMNTLSDDQQDLPSLLSEFLFGTQSDPSDEEINLVFENHARMLASAFDTNKALLNKWLESCVRRKYQSRLTDMLNSLETDQTEWWKPVTERTENRVPEVVAEVILQSLQVFSERMCHLTTVITEFLTLSSRAINVELQNEFNELLRQRWGQGMFRTVRNESSFDLPATENYGEEHRRVARVLRKSNNFKRLEPLPVQQRNWFPEAQWHPIVFIDMLCKEEPQQTEWQPQLMSFLSHPGIYRKRLHLIVLVHGYQGNSFDVRMIKNHIALLRPDLLLMSSSINEGETDGDIAGMGERLAREVTDYIRQWCGRKDLAKVSFIGHSLGGVIIRAALPHLSKLANKMHLFMTFSSPHLGYMYNASKLVGAGMWVLKNVKKNICIKQLSMTDHKDPQQCFMYRLSDYPGLEWFKHIVLISSFQDTYSPFESSRIEMNTLTEAKRSSPYGEMASNLLMKIGATAIHRVDVNFKVKGQNLDNFIGRAAHIQMLDNCALFMMLFTSLPHLFTY